MRAGQQDISLHPLLRAIAVLMVLLAGMSHSGAGPGDNPGPDYPLSLQRATLTVADVERSIAFYRDLLGFTVSARSEYDTPALRRMFNVPDNATPGLVLLDAGAHQPRALALVHAPGMGTDRLANRTSGPALLFNTSRLDDIHRAMLAAGMEVVLPPTPLNDFAGNPFGREAAYLDPDGVRVILFEHD
jgi:catechol 2,3-dioxygenase-like lactoylglutathione lyase family enzyme